MMLPNLQLKRGLKYTGVGARITPTPVCDFMTEFASFANEHGLILRSGGAIRGADAAFERGAGELKEIYTKDCALPAQAFEIAKNHHPVFEYLPKWHQLLLARNVLAVLGGKLNDPSSFLICWTQDAMTKKEQRSRHSGGTGHTIDIALSHGVPVLNLNVQEHFEYVKNTLMGK